MLARATNNPLAVTLMIAAMAMFAVEDTFLKLAAATAHIGQIIVMYALIGTIVFYAIVRASTIKLTVSAFTDRAIIVRTLAEVVASLTYVAALALIPLSTASAVIQAAPLAVTLGAAWFLGETVGWRRWTAVVTGFVGVLLIVQPGTEAFDPASLLAVASAIALSVRDLATRSVSSRIPTTQILLITYIALIPAGLALMTVTGGWRPFPIEAVALTICATMFGLLAYYMLVKALRMGEISAIAPFRYVRLPFALVIGFVVFAEHPDRWMLIGSVLIIVAGLFVVMRERALARREHTDIGSEPLP